MILLNFAHHLNSEQIRQIEELLGQSIKQLLHIPVEFDVEKPFAPQVEKLVDGIQLKPEEWQTEKLLIIPPSLNYIAVLLLAELHGRMGYFPSLVRLKPDLNSPSPEFKIAEILDLQRIRQQARRKR